MAATLAGAALLLALLAAAGCMEPGAAGENAAKDPSERCAAPFLCLTFFVNDRANRVFDEEAGLEWKGSFALTAADGGEIAPAAGWDGPFPRLHDDGPAPVGHEKPGARAGDHEWSTIVRMRAPELPTVLEYGAQWGGENWIWSCNNASVACERGTANGRIVVRASDAGSTLHAAGLILPEHGKLDLKLTLDTGALAGEQAAFPDRTVVQVKGTFSGWALRPCADDGTQGDEVGGDGVWTCVLSEVQSRYDGLLYCGSDMQFVFTLGAAGTEYKVDGVPPQEGVRAWLKAQRGDWEAVPVGRDTGPDQNTIVTTPMCP